MCIVPYPPSHEDAVNDLLTRTGWPDHYDSFIDTDCLVAIDGDGAVGGMIYGGPASETYAQLVPGEHQGRHGWIDLVVVDNPGHGLGTRLMEAFVEQMATQDYAYLMLSIDQRDSQHPRRTSFARACGFTSLSSYPESVMGRAIVRSGPSV